MKQALFALALLTCHFCFGCGAPKNAVFDGGTPCTSDSECTAQDTCKGGICIALPTDAGTGGAAICKFDTTNFESCNFAD